MYRHLTRIGLMSLALCLWLFLMPQTVAQANLIVENTDYAGASSFNRVFASYLGDLPDGLTTVSGALDGEILESSPGYFDANYGPQTADNQDSFLVTVPAGFEMISASITADNLSLQNTSFVTASLSVRSSSGVEFISGDIVEAPDATLFDPVLGPGDYSFSIYGGYGDAVGSYGFDYDVEMVLRPIPEPAASLTVLGALVLCASRRSKKS